MASDSIAEYRAYLTGERHASPNTVSSYLRDVTQFAEYLAEHMPTLTPPNEWRGVEEGLPEIYLDEEGNNIPFLVCGPDSKYPFRALFIGNSWFNGWDPVEVTHWMPLPAPPNRRPSEVAP